MFDDFNDNSVMNNRRLEKFSKKFENDFGDRVESKCFFLFAGSDLNNGSAFQFELRYSKNDDPKSKHMINVGINIDNLTVEQCSDVIVALTQIIPDYRAILRYDDLFNKPDKLNLERMVSFQATMFYLRN